MSAKSELGQTLRDGWRCGTREAELITETVADLDDEQSIEQETGKRTVHFIHGEFKRLEGTLPASVTWNWIVEERYDGDEAYLVDYPRLAGELDIELAEATRMSIGRAVKALIEDLRSRQERRGEELVPRELYEEVVELEDALYRGRALSSFAISFEVEEYDERER